MVRCYRDRYFFVSRGYTSTLDITKLYVEDDTVYGYGQAEVLFVG